MRNARPDTPPPVVYALDALPQLNRGAEAIRAEITEYVAYMALCRKAPTQIHLRPAQFDILLRAAKAAIHRDAPPPLGFTFRGIPVTVLARGGLADAA